MNLDETDWAILQCLQENARMSWKEIGEKVHMTGQAVANRIMRLEESKIIEGYQVRLNWTNAGKPITAFLTILMKSHDHQRFLTWVQETAHIIEVHRISGEGCYLLRAQLTNAEELNQLLEQVLQFANYRLQVSHHLIK